MIILYLKGQFHTPFTRLENARICQANKVKPTYDNQDNAFSE